jgi:hypothetical protein
MKQICSMAMTACAARVRAHRTHFLVRIYGIVAIAGLAVWIIGVRPMNAQQVEKVDTSALRAASGEEWLTYGHDYGGAAYNAETGEKLWSVDLGGNVVTPISYMLDGKQYISVIARPQSNSRVFTFVLDGSVAMPPAPPLPTKQGGKSN